jgi:hypothetical protein
MILLAVILIMGFNIMISLVEKCITTIVIIIADIVILVHYYC